MAVQMNYIAPDGWQPENPDENYVLVQYKMQLADNVPASAFRDAAASVAAESSTGTWTKVEDRPDSGMGVAEEYKALAYDIDEEKHMFKVAYKTDLFEYDNMSGFLAGPVGNIAGMKMEKGIRIFDIRFPKKIVEAFPGPRYGIEGVRDALGHDDQQRKMPILGTVPKPKVGRSDREQADLARRLWTAGDGSYDFIKDDENLTSLPFNTFEDRCRNVLAVARELESQGGKKKLYLCNVTHSNIDNMINRANLIKEHGGRCMMIDVVTTGFAAVHHMRLHNPELIMHGHRAMHGFITRESGEGISGNGELRGFSVAMVVLAKIYRMIGIDSLHVGSPKAKMEDYGESEMIAHMMLADIAEPDPRFHTLGQNWFGRKKTWPVASGGLHPGVLDRVVEKFGPNCYIQLGGGVLGHPQGAERGVEAALEARQAIAHGMTIQAYVNEHTDSALAKAVELWGMEPKIVY
jgi:ribulose-bisphosphate carboxylase large chain